ncbi:endo-beta-N-acetylglucosaminidase [Saccharibacillus alkalitolerans]|uniref:Cytosolic endo-beta-N-acetylglucosaminidase TIM barrel domain-containing protein n=1 Tax=Saccharibacillus alkalitolerans TaxID=2705290 RepID=A0ABX0F250_9BACL|nr:hypothetical protein [Saccharibacillus alkalitolerans]NGZ75051.1 hypothetical protein [Saccharibacillus alkalitolerans]
MSTRKRIKPSRRSQSRFPRRAAAAALAFALIASALPLQASAGDTWPFRGDSAHGQNQPSVHGYTAGHILDWTPERDPDAELLRSRVPLQPRIAPFAATQANPSLSPDVHMMNVAGDYGNAFIENAPYTNKFAQYHFNFWQYTDYYSYWHGTATAYTPPEYYDELAQKDWQQKWFEFGMLNIPNPTYTDAAHKNGVMSLAGIFFSNNDRGQQTYKQMIVKDENGNFPVAEKLIEMAKYFGYDGYFVNQEEIGPNVAVADIPDYQEFVKTLKQSGLYIQWYDSLDTDTGSNTFARTFRDNNIMFLHDKEDGQQVSDSFFFDYGMGKNQIDAAEKFLADWNAEYGTDFNLFDHGYAGLEAGRDRFKNVQGSALQAKLSESGQPRTSLATLGADFVHAGLDEDMGQGWPSSRRSENGYQWMTDIRERLWWSGPNLDPSDTAVSAQNTASDVYADNRYWPGIASVIAERSVVGGDTFRTNFNTGHGLDYYVNGKVSNGEEWSNMSLQDILPSWQWWQETDGSRLDVAFDYGRQYETGGRFDHPLIGAYEGGSSLALRGKLDAETFLRLYKTDLSLGADSTLEVTYNKNVKSDDSLMSVGLIFADAPEEVVKVEVPGSGKKTQGWKTAELDLGAYAGREVAAFGLAFAPGAKPVQDYRMNVGELRISNDAQAAPAAPTGLSIDSVYPESGEMVVNWNLDENYDDVQMYNVYVNDTFVGGKYDETFYIKNIPAQSGVVKVKAVGPDGKESAAAEAPFNLNKAPAQLKAVSGANGELTVSWTVPRSVKGDTTVGIRTVNRTTTGQPIEKTLTIPHGETKAVFKDLPENGDEYIATVSKNGLTPVSIAGTLADKVAEPYAEDWSWNGDTLSLPMPNTRDWRYLYVYEDGKLRSFPTTYNVGDRDRIIRGRTTKASLSFVSTASKVEVVLEDYSGNKSEPVVLRGE